MPDIFDPFKGISTAFHKHCHRKVKIEFYVCDGRNNWFKFFDLVTGEDLGLVNGKDLEDMQ